MQNMDTNDDGKRPRGFATDISTDLDAGRALELAELYALDALDAGEQELVDRYIAAAPQDERDAFNDRVRQAREALALSYTAEEEPPPALWERTVANLPQSPLRTQQPPLATGTPEQTGVPASGDELQAARRRREERRNPSAARKWLIGAVAAGVLTLGGMGVTSYIATQNDPVNQVLQAQDVREATVNVTGGGTATVNISESRDAVVITMNDVPPPPEGKVYQMWLIPEDGSAPVSQGLMDAEALSKPAVVTGIESATALGITVEPEGGSPAPTMPTVAAAPLDA